MATLDGRSTFGVLCYLLVVVVGYFGFVADGVNPGLQIRLSQPGLNYGAGVAVDILAKSVSQLKIPEIHGSARIKVGKVSYDITNIHVTNFVKPGTNVVINPGSGLTWQLNNARISVKGNWHYKYKLGFIVIKDSGSFDGNVEGASLSASVVLGLDQSGHPTISSSGCQCNINSIKIKLHGGASWLYNLFVRYVERPIRDSLKKQICTLAKQAIDDNARKELATLPVQIAIDKVWLFDYRLTASPVFQSGFMDSFHKGEFFFKDDPTEAPYQAATFPPSATDRMVTIWVSDYILNTIGYVFYKRGILKHNLTKNDLPNDQKGLLNTTCTSLTCFGILVPQATKAFPNASAELEMFATSYPTGAISPNNIQGNFAGVINFGARLSNGTLAPMFKTKVSVDVSLMISLNNMVLRGNITKMSQKIQVVESQIGYIPDFVLNGVFNLAAKLFIIPKLNAIGQKGIPIPGIDDVEFSNTKLETDSHCLRISTDVHYSPPAKVRFLSREKLATVQKSSHRSSM